MKKNKILLILSILLIMITITGCGTASSECSNGHTWDEGVIQKEATCEDTGTILYTCTVCEKTKTESIKALGHVASTTWTVSTNTHYHICTRCGATLDEESHTYDETTKTCICGKVEEEDTGYTVTFSIDDNVQIIIYETQDTSGEGTIYNKEETFFARLSTGEVSSSGDAQVNFKVVVPDGYVIDTISVTPSTYKNIKNVNTLFYRVTKVTGNIEITVTIKEQETIEETYFITEISETSATLTHNNEVLTFSFPLGTTYQVNQETGALTLSYNEVATEELTFGFSGNLLGSLIFNINEENDIVIELSNVSIVSETDTPIYILSAGNCDISAKKGTVNEITDNRETIEDMKGAIYATCDLKLKGTGTLNVYSKNNNGIQTKDDLEVQKLTLSVNVCDNALKGNDSVTITSGNLTLIARVGDGIKTSNTDLSSKGKQRGTITIEDGTIDIYAACDGIDASFDVIINGGTINIYTDKYSEYSEEVIKVSESIYYIRSNTTSYKYSIYYYNTESDGVWVDAETSYTTKSNGRENFYYYKVSKLTEYSYLKVYVYNASQETSQNTNYYKVSSKMTLNNNYDTIAFGTTGRPRSTTQSFSWTTYSTTTSGGGMGPNDQGNTDKGDYSTKGIKADNEITINNGTITIKSYDDAIHTNNDNTLESGVTPTGNITIIDGTITLYSNDDAIHADGTAFINGGTITITNSYEGIEGEIVEINGGNISVISSDDGINGTNTTGTSIKVTGGILYVYAGGDGVDSNSQDSYGGILFSGGKAVIISYGRSDSSIDTERGYTYTGGTIIGIGLSGGMSSESTNCKNFSSVGTSKTISLTKDNYLNVGDVVTIKIPFSTNSLIVVLGSTSSSISTTTSSTSLLDSNGVCWK